MFVVDAGQPGDRASTRRPARCSGATGGRCPTDVDRAAPDQPRRRALRRQGVLRRRRSGARRARRARPARKSGPTKVADNKNGYYMSLAPLVADGKVMVGASGGEFGIRGFVAAFDAETGKEAVADLHRARAGRARQRDLAEGRSVEDRRRLGLGHRQLRSGDQPRVLGHRQRRPVDGRSAARRQPLHRVDDRARRRDRHRSRATSSTTRTIRGTGTKCRRRSSSTTSATAAPSRA